MKLKLQDASAEDARMDIRQAGMLAVAIPIAIAVASVVMWAGCRWWYGRKLAAAAHRLHKSEKGRLFSQQQTAQARSHTPIRAPS